MLNKNFYALIIAGLGLGIISGKLGLLYGLVLLALTVGALLFLKTPTTGLYILGFYSLIDFVFRTTGGPLSGVWDELLFIGIIGSYLIYLIVNAKGFQYNLTPLDVPLFIFFGTVVFLVVVNSPDLRIAIDGARVMVQYILWYFIVVNVVKDQKTLRRVLNLLIITTGFVALYGIYQYVIGVEIPAHWADAAEGVTTRAFSIIGSPNILGSLLVLMLPVTFSFGVSEARMGKKLYYFLIATVMLLCLIFTLSRGAWLAFAVAVMAFVLVKDKRLILPMIILVALAFIAVPQVGERISYMLSPEYFASSARGGRIARWTAAIEVFKDNPIFGAGLGRYGGATAARYIEGSKYVDNYYVKTLTESGIIGFTAFMFLLYRVSMESLKVLRIIKGSQFYNIGIGIFAGLIGVMAHSAVENIFEFPMMTSYFWILVAIMISFRSIEISKSSEVK